MVAKCINPYCSRAFRYMGRGKLFVTDYPPTLAAGGTLQRRGREHFWLCEECAKSMTIAIRHEHDQVEVRIINLPPDGKRKLDFVAQESRAARRRPAFNVQDCPEFSF